MNKHISGVGGGNDPFYFNDTTFHSTFSGVLGVHEPYTHDLLLLTVYSADVILFLFFSHTILIQFF